MVNQDLIDQIFSDSSPKRVFRAFRASFNTCDAATRLMLYLRLLEEGLVTRHLARALLRALGSSVEIDRTLLLALARCWSLYVAEDFETHEHLRRVYLSTMNDYETLYLLRQIVQFSPELATRINETLPKTKEQCPASNNLDVAILFSCDKDYFEQKFLTFIAPVLRAQPRVENVYLHLMDGDHNHPSLLELQAQGLTILEDRYELKIDETIRDRIPDAFKEHCRRTWYACARFGVALRLLDVHAKVVILDVDLNITESIESIQGWYGKRSFDVAVRKPKRHRASGVDYWLHESAYAATTKGKQFLATLSVYLDQLMRSGLAFWTLDQCSFNSVIRSKFCENLKVLNLPSGNEVGAHQLTFHRGHNDEHVKGA